jgi:Ca2+/Na+ antiporter
MWIISKRDERHIHRGIAIVLVAGCVVWIAHVHERSRVTIDMILIAMLYVVIVALVYLFVRSLGIEARSATVQSNHADLEVLFINYHHNKEWVRTAADTDAFISEHLIDSPTQLTPRVRFWRRLLRARDQASTNMYICSHLCVQAGVSLSQRASWKKMEIQALMHQHQIDTVMRALKAQPQFYAEMQYEESRGANQAAQQAQRSASEARNLALINLMSK